MILPIIFLCLLILAMAILILFLFYILFPSIKNNEDIKEDPVISTEEYTYEGPDDDKVEGSPSKALVLCNCNKEFKFKKVVYNKEYTCALIKLHRGSETDCKFACIGLGDCLKYCPQNAIIIKNGTAVVTEQCVGCGKCIDICPQKIIKLIPRDTKNYIQCANKDDSITTCSQNKNLVILETNEKKDFKIWSHCYRILKYFK